MPFPTLLRRNRKSEANIRRHSVLVDSSVTSTDPAPSVDPSALFESLSARSSDTPQRPSLVGYDKSGKMPSRRMQHHDRLAPPLARERDIIHPALARFRYASDSQLSTRAKQHAVGDAPTRPSLVPPGEPRDPQAYSKLPPLTVNQDAAPSIVTTAPVPDTAPDTSQMRRSRLVFRSRLDKAREKQMGGSFLVRRDQGAGEEVKRQGARVAPDLSSSGELERSTADSPGAPPAYGDDSNSLLALPLTRLSESSRSDGSSGERIAYATTTTTHTVSTTTTFFRLQRRKKSRPPLCPLPAKVPPSGSNEVCRQSHTVRWM